MRRSAAWSWSNCWSTTNQMEKARIAADDAKEMIPYQVAPLAMGYIYEALGETEKAGQSYEKALKARPGPAPGDPGLGRFLCPPPECRRRRPARSSGS